MSRTVTSQDGHAMRLTSWIVSSHAGHPALNTSILRLVAIVCYLVCDAFIHPSRTSNLSPIPRYMVKG
jgi:hypothetical protein